ncbi:NAD(+)/NADH kinase [Salinilacihabitans rarus]|uniref:NAD(+)/NADH kinase n=1 Tax=Salinilacihabitans rarus TaxID=2961596 RepID=UPI0020C8BD94|nr:NAD(+)/NADH kinase [Salinilacihabitans rarus]
MEVDVGIVAQRDNERARTLAARLVEAIEDGGDRAVVDESTGTAVDAETVPVAEMNGCDFVVSIGGDGTFLFVAREAGDAPILGVNLGEVGFLNAVAPEDAVDAVTDLVADVRERGAVDGREVSRLRACGDGWDLAPALNEVVVHGPRRGRGGGVDVEVRVDGRTYASSHADGVLVATPTGSTAYNLSEGGPLVRPTVDALVVTQMCAAEAMPPLVVDQGSDLSLVLSGTEAAYVISDGRNRRRVDPPAEVTVELADDAVTLAGPPVSFFDALGKLE